MATASSYYGRLHKVLSNNTQQSITATWEGGGSLLKSPPELLTFTDLSFSCYQHNKLIQTTFQNNHRLAVGGMGGEGRKGSNVVGLLTGPFFGPRGRCGVPWTNWECLWPHRPPRLCQESQSDCGSCILQRTHSW